MEAETGIANVIVTPVSRCTTTSVFHQLSSFHFILDTLAG
jgi:hypothetical protein